ncbi:MAG TPA: hypothetical protein DDX40_02470, partial [Rikenellaceae bacterium]|nr:hypothetical protein [Rikenellaceae bacterium]
MAAPKQNTTKKERDRIGMILYRFYALVLFIGVVIIGRMAYIQWFWKPDEDIARFFLPPSTRSVIEPERGAIIGYDGKILAISTPMYRLAMDCTVRKDEFRGKPDSLESNWLAKAKAFTKGLAAETGGDA